MKLSYIRYKFNLEKENDEKLFILSTKEEKRKTHQTIKGKKVNECLKAEKKRCRRKREFLKRDEWKGAREEIPEGLLLYNTIKGNPDFVINIFKRREEKKLLILEVFVEKIILHNRKILSSIPPPLFFLKSESKALVISQNIISSYK